MKRSSQNTLYHLLPIVFWLLAIGGSSLPLLPVFHLQLPVIPYCLPALLILIALWIISSIRRHTDSAEACFWVSVLIGIASYWLPSILFSLLLVWAYLYYLNVFSLRSIFASLLALAFLAVWFAFFAFTIHLPFDFYLTKNLWFLLPIGLFSAAFIASTIVRQNLRVC